MGYSQAPVVHWHCLLFRVNNEATDYDWNSGGGKVRNTLIQVERARTGLADGMGFRTYYYGTGTLNEKRIFRPQYPKVGESKF
ncbi:hypothetical protein [Sphingobacterium sp. MYb388]|uniref:hypothetical protein n=1 Tax=Sphingobacterium sp. MYb388 TaxID=2745437 RepID=UPI0030AAD68F